ncbi:MAG: 4Fe-4S binding protein [Bacilli bacterium]
MKYVTLNKDNKILVNVEMEYFLNPDYVYLPINDKKVLVKQNSNVLKNEVVVDGKNKILSSVSGKAIGLKDVLIGKKNVKSIVVENNFKEESIEIQRKKSSKIDVLNIIKVLEKMEMNDLLETFKSLVKVDNIVISSVEDEPYVKNNIMLLKENINEILEMITELNLLYKSKKNTIVVKSNESMIIDECLNVIGSFPNICITLINDEYLLGRKEYLLDYLKLKENNTLYLTVKDLYKLYNIIKNNRISTTCLITISGDAIETGKVIKAKKYCSLKEIVDKYIKVNSENVVYIINGLMSGFISNINDTILSDDVTALMIMKKNDVVEEKCINCGMCVSVCPLKIDTLKCMKKGIKNESCINCGLCNYVCPSFIDIKKHVKEEL